jgi:hypothetical protein
LFWFGGWATLPAELKRLRRALARLEHLLLNQQAARQQKAAAAGQEEPAAEGAKAMMECLGKHGDPLCLLSRKPVAEDLLIPLAQHVMGQLAVIAAVRRQRETTPEACANTLDTVQAGLWGLLITWGFRKFEQTDGAALDFHTMTVISKSPSEVGKVLRVKHSFLAGLELGDRIIARQLVEVEPAEPDQEQTTPE